jgi:hypothetical protein
MSINLSVSLRSLFAPAALLGVLGAVALATPACSAELDVPNIDLKFTAGASCTPQVASDGGTTPAATTGDGGQYQAVPSEQCGAGLLCFNSYCVGSGALRVSLAWSVNSDFDLHVRTPAGDEIFWKHREAGGGKLDVDQCVLGCWGSAHVENVVFEKLPANGTYTVWVVQYDPRAAGDFTIDVQAGDAKKSFVGTLSAQANAESERFTFDVPLSSPAQADAGGADATPQ